MSGLRCTRCGETWPPLDKYKKCPQCEDKTDPASNIRITMSEQEADSIRSHREFEDFYRRHRKKHSDEVLEPTEEEREKFTLEKWREECAEEERERLKTIGKLM